ncbi:MAG: hypothetical protein EXR73_09330 [Myxococcales bacterium]|nr:hypothetical protein [Myxococcales bacterium]
MSSVAALGVWVLAACALSAASLAACATPAAAPDAAPDGDAAPALVAEAGAARYADVGAQVVLDGSASSGAISYQWSFGDGTGWDTPRPTPVAQTSYAAPGRYGAVLTIFDARGQTRADRVTISVTHPARFVPSQSSSVAVLPGTALVAALSADADELTVIEQDAAGNFTVRFRVPTCDEPATLAAFGEYIAVACHADALAIHRRDGSGPPALLALPTGSRPHGVCAQGTALYVALQASGQLARVVLEPDGRPRLDALLPALPDARAVAALPDGRLAVSRLRSPDTQGELALVDPAGAPTELVPLALDEQAGSDTELGGVPSYLAGLAVSPTGRELAVASLQANVLEGAFRSGRALTFQTTVRGIASFVELGAAPGDGPREVFTRRKQFDNRGFASAAIYSAHGDYLYVAMRGNRGVERFDVLAENQSGAIPAIGWAPEGLALSADDRFLFVDASLSRELVIYDVTSFATTPVALARLPLVTDEPLAPDLLVGKRLFGDSEDPRLSRDGYIACAHCHLDGEADGRVWDFSDRGEGLRNTISLLGRAGVGDGPIHWSANFDEVQDFENDIRNAFGGAGLMADADFAAGTRAQTLGDPKAGTSVDLDALAAYVSSLVSHPPSPHREPDGTLGAAARRGELLFASSALGCTDCHSGPRFTDSAFLAPNAPRLHDVGTLGLGSGGRLGGTLTGIDTPTLIGLFSSAPYLHDGSAATLAEIFTVRNSDDRHGRTTQLVAGDIDDLVAYLIALDGRAD